MLSLYKLEIFNAVVQEGSFSGAAKRLLLTQPAVSQHVQSLESSLGTRLFERGRRGVQLTPAGETLYDYTRCILRLLAEAESAITNVEQLDSGQIRIGATPGAGMYLIPDWMRTFQSRFPQLSISLLTDVTAQIAAGILNHSLDLGFAEGELDDNERLDRMVLQEVSQFIIVGQGHPWYAETAVPFAALNGQPFITRPRNSQTRVWLDQLFNRYSISPNIVAEFDNPEAIKQAVISGMGITLLPEYAIRREQKLGIIRALPVQNVVLQRALTLTWRRQESFAPVTRAFLTHLAGQFPQLLTLPRDQPILAPRLARVQGSEETCAQTLNGTDHDER
jgi:DNA-binding transcriptional LysR family regulator